MDELIKKAHLTRPETKISKKDLLRGYCKARYIDPIESAIASSGILPKLNFSQLEFISNLTKGIEQRYILYGLKEKSKKEFDIILEKRLADLSDFFRQANMPDQLITAFETHCRRNMGGDPFDLLIDRRETQAKLDSSLIDPKLKRILTRARRGK